MDSKQQPDTQQNEGGIEQTKAPRCVAVAQAGIRTGGDFAELMSCLMSDIIEGRITPSVGNATVNAGGKLLKVVEMQHRYGTDGPGSTTARVLQLTPKKVEEPVAVDK